MIGNQRGTFVVDGSEYPIKPSIYPEIQTYLHSKDHVKWVCLEEPYVKYGVQTKNGDIKRVRRHASSLLTDSDIGRFIIKRKKLTNIK